MEAKVSWLHGLRFVGTSGSGHSVVMDGNGGDTAPSPMEMVLMSAASCSSVDVVSILQKARQQISGCEVDLKAERADTTPAVFTAIHMHFIVAGTDIAESHVERAVKLSADKYCSVSIMLGHSVNVTHSFEIRNS
ncbi:MAG: putative redox protein YhfA [Idiomarinaceae bacterium HL-53]|nr:MAG: putative redox protein YhfA [Idiomarinaceae bacterium HL-53]CUS48185.1 putative redox protein [Idiomarinaceae bacterium HL-53]